MHDYLTQPQVSESDLIVHALNFLSCSVKDVLASVYTNELTAISNLRDLFSGWNPQHPPTLPLPAPPPLRQPPRVVTPTTTLPPPPAPNLDPPRPPLTSLHTPGQKLPNLAELNSHDLPPPLRRSPRVHTSPNMPIKVDEPAPVAHRTRTRLKMSPLATASRTSPSKFIKIWAASAVLHGNQWSPLVLFVLDPETGQSLEHRAIRRHPRLGPDWNTSYSNEPTASTNSASTSTSSPAPTSKGGHTYNNPTTAPSSKLRPASTPAHIPAHPWSEAPQPCRAKLP